MGAAGRPVSFPLRVGSFRLKWDLNRWRRHLVKANIYLGQILFLGDLRP